MINPDNAMILAQLIEAMNDAARKLEGYYEKRDIENFNKAKKIILDFQQKINGMIS